MAGSLFIIAGPSGSGKTSLVQALVMYCSRQGYPLQQVVTYTTRTPRPGDVDGEQYHFLSQEGFEQKIQEGFFLEWSRAYGNYYGSPRSIIADLACGINYMMILDRAGAAALKQQIPAARLIWIEVSSLEVLRERLERRQKNVAVQIAWRLKLAAQEIEQEKNEPFFDVHIQNNDFMSAFNELLACVLGVVRGDGAGVTKNAIESVF